LIAFRERLGPFDLRQHSEAAFRKERGLFSFSLRRRVQFGAERPAV